MAKQDTIEKNKDQKNEKLSKKIKTSSYSKKKKLKKNILNGKAFVQSTFNNTIISIADTNGNVEIGRAHVRTPVTSQSRMPSSA